MWPVDPHPAWLVALAGGRSGHCHRVCWCSEGQTQEAPLASHRERPQRNQACWHPDLGPVGSLHWNWGNKLLLFKPPSLWHLAALAKLSCGPPRQGAVLLSLERGLANAGPPCLNGGESIEIKFPEGRLPGVELHGERAGLGVRPRQGLWACDSAQHWGLGRRRRLHLQSHWQPHPHPCCAPGPDEPLRAGCKESGADSKDLHTAGAAWPSAQEVPSAPWLAFQPPRRSPVPCGALGLSHLSAWEVQLAVSSKAAESGGSSAGASSGLPVPGPSPRQLCRAHCRWPAGHAVGRSSAGLP